MRKIVLGAAVVLACAGIGLWDQAAQGAAVSWVPNASGAWETATNWSSNPALPGAADDVTINQPAAITVSVTSSTQSIRSLTTQEDLSINSATLNVGAGGGAINGALSFSNGRLVSQSAGTLTINGALSVNGSFLQALTGGVLVLPAASYSAGNAGSTIQADGGGSTINFSTVTSFSGGTFSKSNVLAQAGGLVNLSGVTSITVGATSVESTGAGSIVNLSALTTFGANNFIDVRRLRAESGGAITSPNLKTLGEVNVEIVGATSTIGLAGVNSANNSSLFATSGGTIALPALTSYSADDSGSSIQANGAGSVVNLSNVTSFAGGTFNRTNVQAQAGGLVNLSGLTSITVGATSVESTGAGSVVNLSALTTFNGTNFADGRRLRAESGGAITSPNLKTLGRVNIEIIGATSTIGLASVNSANTTSLFASSGGVLSLPALTSYSADNNGSTINSNGTGSVINLSNATLFSGGTFNRTNVQAQAGGLVNLSGVTSITVGATNVESTGAGSIVNLSALTTFDASNFADTRRLRAESGGAITSPNLHTLGRVNIEMAGATSTIGLAGVNSANTTSLFASSGGVLSLPALTSYSADNNGSTINSNGTGSVINLSNATSFSGGSFNRTNVQAQAGGLVNLSGVTSITVGATNVESTGAGSVVNLSALTTFSGDNLADARRLRAESGGTIMIRAAGPTTANNVTVDMVGGGTITGNTLALGAGTTFTADGTLGANLNNTAGTVVINGSPGSLNVTGNFSQGIAGTIRFDVGGTTPITQYEQVNITGSGHDRGHARYHADQRLCAGVRLDLRHHEDDRRPGGRFRCGHLDQRAAVAGGVSGGQGGAHRAVRGRLQRERRRERRGSWHLEE